MEAQTYPLSGPQRRALQKIAAWDKYDPSPVWWSSLGYHSRTLAALKRRGMVELRENTNRLSGWDIRITPKGREAIR